MSNGVVTKYYYAGSQRIALRNNGTLNFLLGDHLGSTSLTTSATGAVLSELRYKAWGEVRYSSGTTATKYQYTGQYSHASEFGLLYYNARWVDPVLGRFAQADSITPNGLQGLDRYAYSNNSPVRYTDPSGHTSCEGPNGECDISYSTPTSLGQLRGRLRSYGVKLTGDWRNHTNEQWAVFFGVEAVGWRLAAAGYGKSATGAFKNVYGAVHFQWGGCGDDCRSRDKKGKPYGNEGGAFSSGWQSNHGDGYWLIKIATMTDDGGVRGMRQMIHELGHTYDYANEYIRDTMPDNIVNRNSLRPNGYWNNGIFTKQDDAILWQYHPAFMTNGNSKSEIFADMFIAWTLDAWNIDPANANAVRDAQDWMP